MGDKPDGVPVALSRLDFLIVVSGMDDFMFFTLSIHIRVIGLWASLDDLRGGVVGGFSVSGVVVSSSSARTSPNSNAGGELSNHISLDEDDFETGRLVERFTLKPVEEIGRSNIFSVTLPRADFLSPG